MHLKEINVIVPTKYEYYNMIYYYENEKMTR